MSGLILPPHLQQAAPQMGVSSSIQLNDSELARLLDGPIAWAELQAGKSMSIDAFVRALTEKINDCGFSVEVKLLETNQPGLYGFDAEINGRIGGSVFDPDRQVHEVVNNYLGLKGEQEGFIKSKDGVAMLEQREKAKNHKH